MTTRSRRCILDRVREAARLGEPLPFTPDEIDQMRYVVSSGELQDAYDMERNQLRLIEAS